MDKGSEWPAGTALYIYTPQSSGRRLLSQTVGLVNFTPFCLDTIHDFMVGTNTLPSRI